MTEVAIHQHNELTINAPVSDQPPEAESQVVTPFERLCMHIVNDVEINPEFATNYLLDSLKNFTELSDSSNLDQANYNLPSAKAYNSNISQRLMLNHSLADYIDPDDMKLITSGEVINLGMLTYYIIQASEVKNLNASAESHIEFSGGRETTPFLGAAWDLADDDVDRRYQQLQVVAQIDSAANVPLELQDAWLMQVSMQKMIYIITALQQQAS